MLEYLRYLLPREYPSSPFLHGAGMKADAEYHYRKGSHTGKFKQNQRKELKATKRRKCK